jgi:hypothetical protein
MRLLSWTICLWPGLASLWLRGRWQGLAVALAFAGLLNFALISTFVWPRLVSPAVPAWATGAAAWVLVLGFWIAGIHAAGKQLARRAQTAPADDQEFDAWLWEAQTEYLKGHWIEAETLVSRQLARRADDAPARLLLASVFRRTQRLAEARQTLNHLKQSPAATNWLWEIEAELAQLAELEAAPRTPNQNSSPPLARAA